MFTNIRRARVLNNIFPDDSKMVQWSCLHRHGSFSFSRNFFFFSLPYYLGKSQKSSRAYVCACRRLNISFYFFFYFFFIKRKVSEEMAITSEEMAITSEEMAITSEEIAITSEEIAIISEGIFAKNQRKSAKKGHFSYLKNQ